MSMRASRSSASARDGLRGWVHETLRGLGAQRAILAVGCDAAFFAPHLLEHANHVTVLDTSGDQIAQLASRFPEIAFRPHRPGNPLPFPRETFDAVWCADVLDRVFNPAAALREMHRVLTPDGRLLVAVPDCGAMQKLWRTLVPRGEEPVASPRVRCFTRAALARLARAAGFVEVEIVSVRHAGGDGEAPARKLLLRARKERRAEPIPVAERAEIIAPMEFFAEELAFADRMAA